MRGIKQKLERIERIEKTFNKQEQIIKVIMECIGSDGSIMSKHISLCSLTGGLIDEYTEDGTLKA